MSSGWTAFGDAVAQARAEIAAHAPDPMVAAEGEAYVMRVAAAALADACLKHLLVENGLVRALPVKGGPNPDYRIASAPIDPARHYRIEGQLNGSERVGVGLYALGPNAAPLEVGYAAFERTNTDPDGRFALDMAPASQTVAAASTVLPIPSACRLLITRTLHRSDEQPARLVLSGGTAETRLSMATGSSEGALGRAAGGILAGVREYLKWTQAVVARPNRFDPPPPELAATAQGDRDTRYFLGSYELGEDEWLEVTMPANLPGYWSVHAYNHWFESLQAEGADDRNTAPDPDGRIRVRIGPSLPSGLPNSVDTLGRTRGALICRIIGAHDPSAPATRLVRSEP